MQQEIAVVNTKIENLESWQEKQNGRMERIENKIDKLQFWIMGALFVALVNVILAVYLKVG